MAFISPQSVSFIALENLLTACNAVMVRYFHSDFIQGDIGFVMFKEELAKVGELVLPPLFSVINQSQFCSLQVAEYFSSGS
ncbi:hypothetical protein F0562_020025 [Nyssa sinensis]|uniref:Uncharacterized protein n=1 Tax=Nyssa sinensis TaxID=561372 RepID=A0A5J5BVE3_9ASTE|nr:hypothetical protein F0562_020025 [Nyssa sinensis]